MKKLIDTCFIITIDTDVENVINMCISNNRIVKFTRRKNGLYFHGTEDCQMSFLNSQHENSLLHIRR